MVSMVQCVNLCFGIMLLMTCTVSGDYQLARPIRLDCLSNEVWHWQPSPYTGSSDDLQISFCQSNCDLSLACLTAMVKTDPVKGGCWLKVGLCDTFQPSEFGQCDDPPCYIFWKKGIGCDSQFDNFTGSLSTERYIFGTSYNYTCEIENFYQPTGNSDGTYLCTKNAGVQQWIPAFSECEETRLCTQSTDLAHSHKYIQMICCGTQMLVFPLILAYPTNVNAFCPHIETIQFNMSVTNLWLVNNTMKEVFDAILFTPVGEPTLGTYETVATLILSTSSYALMIMSALACILAALGYRRLYDTLCITNFMTCCTLFFAEFLQFIYGVFNPQLSCGARSISVQFFYSWGFCFQLLRSLELLGIHGNMLTNSHLTHPVLAIIVSLILPIFQTCIAMGFWGETAMTKATCWLSLSGIVGLTYLITSLLISYATLVATESCVPFRKLRIRRQDSPYDLIFLANLHFWFVIEVPLGYAAWLVGIAAVDYQSFFLYIVTSKLNIAVGVVTLLAQLGGTTRFCQIRRQKKVFPHDEFNRPHNEVTKY